MGYRSTKSPDGCLGVNPPLALDMSVRARLIRVSDGTELYSDIWTYNGTRHKFAGWALNNAHPFREQLDRASQSLAYTIIWTLFRYPMHIRR